MALGLVRGVRYEKIQHVCQPSPNGPRRHEHDPAGDELDGQRQPIQAHAQLRNCHRFFKSEFPGGVHRPGSQRE